MRLQIPGNSNSPLSAWENKAVLRGIRDLIIDAPGYNVEVYKQQLQSFLAASREGFFEPKIVRVLHNDPRIFSDEEFEHVVQFRVDHNGHIH